MDRENIIQHVHHNNASLCLDLDASMVGAAHVVVSGEEDGNGRKE